MKKVYRILIIVAVSLLGLGVLALLAYLIWRKLHRKKIAKLSEKLESLEKNLRQEYTKMISQRKNDDKDVKSIIEDKIGDIPLYYINLNRNPDRRRYMEDQIRLYNIKNQERIEAIDGQKFLDRDLDGGIVRLSKKYVQFFNNYSKYSLGELGCTLSHILAIRTAYDNGDDIALILEDDVSLALVPFWKVSLKDVIQSAPKDWKIINLCGLQRKCYEGNRDKEFLPFPDYVCWGAQAYLINRRGMETILEEMPKGNIILDEKDKSNSGNIEADFFLYKRAKNSYTYVKYPLFFPYNISFASNIGHDGHQLQFLNRAVDSII